MLQDEAAVLRLWYHECCRVFQDRLVNDEDRDWFDQLLRSKIRTDFSTDPEAVLGTAAIIFGDFLDPSLDIRPYVQIPDMEKVGLPSPYQDDCYYMWLLKIAFSYRLHRPPIQ